MHHTSRASSPLPTSLSTSRSSLEDREAVPRQGLESSHAHSLPLLTSTNDFSLSVEDASTDVVSTHGHVSASREPVAAYRDDPYVVQLMRAKWASLRQQVPPPPPPPHAEGANADRPPQQASPRQHTALPTLDLYTYFFAPTLAVVPATPTRAPCASFDDMGSAIQSATTGSTPPEAVRVWGPSAEREKALAHTVARLFEAEEAVRGSPPLTPLALPPPHATSPPSVMRAGPPQRSSTASPLKCAVRASPSPQSEQAQTVTGTHAETEARTGGDDARQSGHRHTPDPVDTTLSQPSERRPLVIPARYVSVAHLPTTGTVRDAAHGRTCRPFSPPLAARPSSPAHTETSVPWRTPGGDRAQPQWHRRASDARASSHPQLWNRLFRWAHTPSSSTATRTRLDAHLEPTHADGNDRDIMNDVYDEEGDDEEEDEDDDLRMLMHNTALNLCCCGLVDCCCDPSANVFFGVRDDISNEGLGDEVEDEDAQGLWRGHRTRNNLDRPVDEGYGLLSAHRSNPAPLYLRDAPSAGARAGARSAPRASPGESARASSPASRRLQWDVPSPNSAAATSSGIADVRRGPEMDASALHPSSHVTHQCDCCVRWRRSCVRKLRRTWRYLNVFTTSGSSDDDAPFDDRSEEGDGGRVGMRAHYCQRAADSPPTADAQPAPHSSPAQTPSPSRLDTTANTGADASPRLPRHRRRRTERRLRRPELPRVARWYCLLNYAAAALTVVSASLLTWCVYGAFAVSPTGWRLDGQYDVRDGTVCHTLSFTERLRPDLSFSVACFLVNSYFLVWCALRAVRLESPGLLLGHALLAIIEVSRIVYFICYVAGRYLVVTGSTSPTRSGVDGRVQRSAVFRTDRAPFGDAGTAEDDAERTPHMTALGRTANALLLAAAVLLVASLALAASVRRAFGWGSFLQGWTQPESLTVRRRFTYFQTCVQLDGVVTLNVSLALIFLLDKPVDHVLNALSLCATWLMLVLLTPLLYRAARGLRYAVVMSVAAAVFGSSLVFYITTVVRDVRAYTFDTVTDGADDLHRDPRKSPCYKAQLMSCLVHQYMVVVGRHNTTQRVEQVILDGDVRRDVVADAATAFFRDRPWTNGSSTYLFTHSRQGEMLALFQCPIDTCFPQEGLLYVERFHRCCARYGVCRLKDAFRTYGVMLVLFLTLTLVVVRSALVWLSWRRASLGDDDAIIALRRRHRSGVCRSQRQRTPPPQPSYDRIQPRDREGTPLLRDTPPPIDAAGPDTPSATPTRIVRI